MSEPISPITLTDGQRVWLANLYSKVSAGESPDVRTLKGALKETLPKDFDPTEIDYRLLDRDNQFTLLGLALLDPSSDSVKQANQVIQSIHDLLLSESETKMVDTHYVSAHTNILPETVANIFERLSLLELFHHSGTTYGHGVNGLERINIDEDAFNSYRKYQSLQDVLNDLIKDKNKLSLANVKEQSVGIAHAMELYDQVKHLSQNTPPDRETAKLIIELTDDAIHEFGSTNQRLRVQLKSWRNQAAEVLPPSNVKDLIERAEGRLLDRFFPKNRLLRGGLIWVVAFGTIAVATFALYERFKPSSTAHPNTGVEATSSLRIDTSHPKVVNRFGIELVYIPPGTFMMGSTDEEVQNVYDSVVEKVADQSPELFSREKPKHRVTIKQSFYMGQSEITIGQWKTVMGNLPELMNSKDFPSRLKADDNQPVVDVSWDDATQFIAKLNALNDGYIYSLPSEAQWEYACRADTHDSFGGELNLMAWYGDNSGRDSLDSLKLWGQDPALFNRTIKDNQNKTHIVKTKQSNHFGLYDMIGNVWEWCEDYYHPKYDGDPPTDGTPWLKDGDMTSRVVRGGGWRDGSNWERPAVRQGRSQDCSSAPNCRSNDLGFRIVALEQRQLR